MVETEIYTTWWKSYKLGTNIMGNVGSHVWWSGQQLIPFPYWIGIVLFWYLIIWHIFKVVWWFFFPYKLTRPREIRCLYIKQQSYWLMHKWIMEISLSRRSLEFTWRIACYIMLNIETFFHVGRSENIENASGYLINYSEFKFLINIYTFVIGYIWIYLVVLEIYRVRSRMY